MSRRQREILFASVVVLSVASLACDPVRPGDYDGNYPGPNRVAVPQTPEWAAMAERPRALLMAQVRIRRMLPPRNWGDFGEWGVNQWINDDSPLPASIDAPIWPALGGAFDWTSRNDDLVWPVARVVMGTVEVALVEPGTSPESLGTALVAEDVRHVFVAATQDTELQPIGPSGPTLWVPSGFHVFRRTCSSDGAVSFDEVPLDVSLTPVPVATATASAQDRAADYPDIACGIEVSATIELGDRVAPIPTEPPGARVTPAPLGVVPPPLRLDAFAWRPGADGLYWLATQLSDGSTWPAYAQVDYLPLGAAAPALIASGDLKPPLFVGTGGSSLLLWSSHGTDSSLARFSLTGELVPFEAPLLTSGGHALSPDGNLLVSSLDSALSSYVMASSNTVTFIDVRTLRASALLLPPPYAEVDSPRDVLPRAWAPDGRSVLLEIRQRGLDSYTAVFAIAPLVFADGLPSAIAPLTVLPSGGLPEEVGPRDYTHFFPSPDTSLRLFWSASGPQALIQNAAGARVYNFATQQTLMFVEPNRVAQAETPIDVVAATDQVFAWAVQCFGLGETSCKAELRRASLSTGAIHRVATADRPRVFAVSPDGTRIAFADQCVPHPAWGAVLCPSDGKAEVRIKAIAP